MTDPQASADALVPELADDPDLIELVRAFVGDRRDRLAAIDKTLAEQALDDLARLAHQLKAGADLHQLRARVAGSRADFKSDRCEGLPPVHRLMLGSPVARIERFDLGRDQVKIGVDVLGSRHEPLVHLEVDVGHGN